MSIPLEHLNQEAQIIDLFNGKQESGAFRRFYLMLDLESGEINHCVQGFANIIGVRHTLPDPPPADYRVPTWAQPEGHYQLPGHILATVELGLGGLRIDLYHPTTEHNGHADIIFNATDGNDQPPRSHLLTANNKRIRPRSYEADLAPYWPHGSKHLFQVIEQFLAYLEQQGIRSFMPPSCVPPELLF